ncbi:MAG: hypothetical protein ABR581_10395 [Thermoleophilaceae bacterium]
MIVDRLGWRALDGRVERSARLRFGGRELRLGFSCPDELAAPEGDATAFVPAALLPAMRVHEDLEIEGEVSPALLRRLDRVQSLYHAWDRSLRRARVQAAAERPAAGAAEGVGAFFSRGVDSMYTAAGEWVEDGPLTALLFGETLEPMHSAPVRQEELRLAGEAARRIGLTLIPFRTNIRELSDGFLDWGDYHGAALAFAGLSLSGGLGRVLIPSTGWYGNIERFGSSPLLDPLFSSEDVRVEHASLERSRMAKVRWLTENRRDLLPFLKVCLGEDRPDNCGQCPKCLTTMVCLHAAGALRDAEGFPDEVDLRALRRLRMALLSNMLDTADAVAALGSRRRDRAIRRALLRALRRSTRPTLDMIVHRLAGRRDRVPRTWTMTTSAFRRHEARERISLLVKGRPYW